MKRLALTLIVSALAGIAAALSGCDTRIEEPPIKIAELRAAQTIEEAGADPADWKFAGQCVAMGPCQVEVSAADMPEEVLATDRYTVKDSRASVNGPERIQAAAEAVVRGGCFDQISTATRLRACVSGS